MSKMSADVNRQYEELKKLIVGNTQQPPVMGNPVQSSTVSRGPLVAPPFRSFDNRIFASAGENAMMSGRPPQMNQSPGYLVCWDSGISGHARRDCPSISRAPPNQQSQGNTANRHSRKVQDKARVYIKMKLLGKVIPCLMDSGCEATLVLKTLTDRFAEGEGSTRSESSMGSK